MATGDFALTVPQIKEAVRLHRYGYSPRQIASHFGKSRMAVRNALRLMDVPSRDRIEASAESNRARATVKRTGAGCASTVAKGCA